ncbi:hypothetical protein FACS1894180_0860 [Bacteroidia bacterium]|nr:hypothetical protein FACS1894180_0860 [Bacteroidia bacterium]
MKDKTLHISRAEASKPLLLRAVCVVVGLVCAVNTANGAMTKDLNKGIQSITYNELSLPLKIEIATLALGGTNEYKYTSTGIKLHVTHNWNANINGSVIGGSSAEQRQETDYIGNKIYENGKLKMILTDNGYIQDGEYFFYIKDHLGNNRIVVNESGHIVQSTDYYPYGLPTPDAVSTETQPYKYNGKELDNISGLNLYDYSARHYDPVIGSFTTVDPLAEKYYSISPYAYCANNPVRFIDPTGMVYGDYYNIWGKYLGSDGINDDKVYLASGTTTTNNADGTATTTFSDALELNMTHTEFQKQAATVYGESSAYAQSGPTNELAKEMGAIAYVHQNNKKAYGDKSDQAKLFKGTKLEDRTGKMQLANWAIINVAIGGYDYSNGATMWDGAEQSQYNIDDAHTKMKNGAKIELHMNTMGWNISNEHYQKWQTAVGSTFKAPQVKTATTGINKGKIRLLSTAVYNRTIFWRTTK